MDTRSDRHKSTGGMFAHLARAAWRYADGQRGRMALVYALLLAANAIVMMQPVVLAQIIDTAQAGGSGALRAALLWSALYGGLTLIFWLLHGPARVIERQVAFAVYHAFTDSMYRKVADMPLRWHQDHHSGGTISRVTKAGKALHNFAGTQFILIQVAVRFTASLAALAFYSWWVAAASVVSAVAVIGVMRRFDKRLWPLVDATNEKEHALNAALYDYIGNIVTVLTLRLQGNTAGEIRQRFGAMKPPLWQQITLNEKKWFTLNMMLIFAQAGIVGAYVAAHLAQGAALAAGSVAAVFQYLLSINMQFFNGTIAYETTSHQYIDLRGVEGLEEDHARLCRAAGAVEGERAWKLIRIRDLDFTHHEGEEEMHTLRGVTLDIAAGRKIALIGSSGSGKTTLLTLLRGLYEAQRARVEIDGAAFETLAPLAGFTTLVPQDSEIFENTVRYNLTLGTDVPEEVVRQALYVTTFDEVASKLPRGLDTDIRERGVNLSGGQKQRLALARGLIAARNSSLVLLDEPTSSVDLATEAALFDRLFAVFADQAVIASIHRLHLLPRFHWIGLMRDGALIEQGSFGDLLARRGEFARMWQDHLVQSAAGMEED